MSSDELSVLVERLHDPREDVRERSVDQITELKPDGAFDIILPLLQDASAEVRGTVASSLGELGDPRAIPLLIAASENDPNEDVREQALFSLGSFESPEIMRRLLSEISKPKDSRRPRQIVARQLAKYPNRESVDGLVELLSDADPYVRIFAADSLHGNNQERLRPVWSATLQDETPYVRAVAQQALSELNGDRS